MIYSMYWNEKITYETSKIISCWSQTLQSGKWISFNIKPCSFMSTYVRIETFEADKTFDFRVSLSGSDAIDDKHKEFVLWHALVN
jgi:hypothetical protein